MSDTATPPGVALTPTLHVLTPAGPSTAAALLGAGALRAADLVADLSHFPPVVYHVAANPPTEANSSPEAGLQAGTPALSPGPRPALLRLIDVTADLLPPQDYWAIARRWLAEVTLATGLQDTLVIEGYGFWWTLNAQRFVPALSELGNTFAWIDLLAALCRQHAPGSIVVHGRHAAILHLVSQLCPNVAAVVRGDAPPSRRRRRLSLGRAGLLAARVVAGAAYLLYSLVRRPHVAFFSTTTLVRPAGSGPGTALRDVYLQDVAGALRARGWRTVTVEKYGPNASWAAFRARLRSGAYFPNDLLFLFSHPSLQRRGPYRALFQKWSARWQAVRSGVAPHLTYHGCDLSPLLLPLIAREFTQHAPNLEILTRAWRRILRLWRPRLLYVSNSYGRSAVPAIIAAKTLAVPTVEQQHGVMNRDHITYLVPRAAAVHSDFPLCDRFVVWGDYFKRLLVNAGAYPADRVTVTGFPRIDTLLGDLPPRGATLAALHIPPAAHVALYTSNEVAAPFRPDILDGLADPSVSGAESDAPDLYSVIKLHPRETGRAEWEAGLAARGLDRVRVVQREIDFYALLAACDVHASFTSTTLVEAAILGKLNLGLDVAGVPDPVGYAAAGAFLPVAPRRLGPVAAQVLNDADLRQRLAAEQRAFARDWCVHDGRAVERIVSLLEAIMTGGVPDA